MSSASYAQVENDNNQKLDKLADKLATFRNINQDIGDQAINDSSVLNSLSDTFDAMMSNLKNTSGRLGRAMRSGNNIWRMVGLSLLLFFIIYNLFKFL